MDAPCEFDASLIKHDLEQEVDHDSGFGVDEALYYNRVRLMSYSAWNDKHGAYVYPMGIKWQDDQRKFTINNDECGYDVKKVYDVMDLYIEKGGDQAAKDIAPIITKPPDIEISLDRVSNESTIRQISMKISPEKTGGDLKEQIYCQLGIPKEQHTLALGKTLLEDSTTLQEQNVKEGDVLLLNVAVPKEEIEGYKSEHLKNEGTTIYLWGVRHSDHILQVLLPEIECEKVTEIDLYSAGITDVGMGLIADKCKQLKNLSAAASSYSDVGMIAIAKQCKDITNINLAHSKVTDASLKEIAQNCKDLQELSLNQLYTVTGEGLKEIAANCNELTYIDLRFCRGMGAAVVELAQKTKLTKFLYDTFTDEGITELKALGFEETSGGVWKRS